MYHDGYGYHHPTCSIFGSFCDCPDNVNCFGGTTGSAYRNGYWRYRSLYLQLEYDTCFRPELLLRVLLPVLIPSPLPMRGMYDDGYGYDHTACSIFNASITARPM